MKSIHKIAIIITFLLANQGIYSQHIGLELNSDTIGANTTVPDSALWVNMQDISSSEVSEQQPITSLSLMRKPDSKKAVLYSLMFPGLGQVYNKKYWKLPIIYGGFIGLTYAISWNGRYYKDYLNAFKDISDDDATTNSWHNFLSPSVDPTTLTDAQIANYTTVFQNRKNYYRRYRDLSIIGVVALYALCAIDAYIDAQLFDFNVSEDVSMQVKPAIIPSVSNKSNSIVNSGSVGVHCNITF